MENTNLIPEKRRIDWIDCTKGIAILLVIVGHTVSQYTRGSVVRGLIFSFHMPLFFIMSGITYYCSSSEGQFVEKAYKAAKKLLIPAVAVYVLSILITVCKSPELMTDLAFWKGRVYTLLFASGVGTSFGTMDVFALGALWFCFALFFGRTIFDYLHLKFSESQFGIVCMFASLIGIIFGGGGGMAAFFDRHRISGDAVLLYRV